MNLKKYVLYEKNLLEPTLGVFLWLSFYYQPKVCV